ncbi:hypothetical protein [Mastigocladopsis repens]|uniref:hypothetical protein n=1 Tax=Mastigocladopsis repens TaxID=221287 RepID=UPI00031D2BE5|nr:hypothetical protein [Mastigocladopsis repens]
MASDHILFIHGVNTREVREQPQYADQLFQRLQEGVSNDKRDLNKIALYWGDVNKSAEDDLLKQLQASSFWEQMWFRTFREQQILQFAGDAALYISRHVGSKVINRLKTQAFEGLKNAQPDDCLHLVTHSWGTVILFDILFARRWDDPKIPGHEDVMAIRDAIYGIGPHQQEGLKIASIHTLGSPIAIFTLTNIVPGKDGIDSPSTHDITPELQKLLESLYVARNHKKLPWRNYIHLGDPIAYPLKELMTNLVDGDTKYLDIQDVITQEPAFLDFLTAQSVFSLAQGGKAHGSYFTSNKVVQEISGVLKKEAPMFTQS